MRRSEGGQEQRRGEATRVEEDTRSQKWRKERTGVEIRRENVKIKGWREEKRRGGKNLRFEGEKRERKQERRGEEKKTGGKMKESWSNISWTGSARLMGLIRK